MGNTSSYKEYYNYSTLDEDQTKHIRKYYKIIDAEWLDKVIVNSKIFNDEYFTKSPKKKKQ